MDLVVLKGGMLMDLGQNLDLFLAKMEYELWTLLTKTVRIPTRRGIQKLKQQTSGTETEI